MKRLFALIISAALLLASCAPAAGTSPSSDVAAQTGSPTQTAGAPSSEPPAPSTETPAPTETPGTKRTVTATLKVLYNPLPSYHGAALAGAPDDFYAAYKSYAAENPSVQLRKQSLFHELTVEGSPARLFVGTDNEVFLYIDDTVYCAEIARVNNVVVWDYDGNGVADLLMSGVAGSGTSHARLALFDAAKKQMIRLEKEKWRQNTYSLCYVQTDAQGIPYLAGAAREEIFGKVWSTPFERIEYAESGFRFVDCADEATGELTLSGYSAGFTAEFSEGVPGPGNPPELITENVTFRGEIADKLLQMLPEWEKSAVKPEENPSQIDRWFSVKLCCDLVEGAQSFRLIGSYRLLRGVNGTGYIERSEKTDAGTVYVYYVLPEGSFEEALALMGRDDKQRNIAAVGRTVNGIAEEALDEYKTDGLIYVSYFSDGTSSRTVSVYRTLDGSATVLFFDHTCRPLPDGAELLNALPVDFDGNGRNGVLFTSRGSDGRCALWAFDCGAKEFKLLRTDETGADESWWLVRDCASDGKSEWNVYAAKVISEFCGEPSADRRPVDVTFYIALGEKRFTFTPGGV